MKNTFNKQVAKTIAGTSFNYMLDCILGLSDSGYTLNDDGESFEQNFTEDLEEMNIAVTPKRIKIIIETYDKKRDHLKRVIEKFVSK